MKKRIVSFLLALVMAASCVPTALAAGEGRMAVAVSTPMRPGRMNEWLITKRPMWVVPERSNCRAARSDGYVGRM